MGKEIKQMFSRSKPGTQIKAIRHEEPRVELRDLKHDLENQLIKIKQRLENLRMKAYSPWKPIHEQYKTLCEEYTEESSSALVFIDRLVNQMFCEIACITIIDGKSSKISEYEKRFDLTVYKFIHRTLLLYWDDLKKNHVHHNLRDSKEIWHANEYILSWIFLKIIENCAKYCKPHSSIDITISAEKIVFSMTSLKIEYTERAKIFEKDYSWKNALKSWISSTWKWLYHAKELADFQGFSLSVNPWTKIEEYEGKKYAQNEFILSKNSSVTQL